MQVTGPLSIAGGATIPLPLPSAVTSWRWLVISNQSAMLVAVNINGARWLQPWTADAFDVSGGPYVQITPQGTGTGTVTAQWYGPSDPPPTGYPAPLSNSSPAQIYTPIPTKGSSATAAVTLPGGASNVSVLFGIGAAAGDLGLIITTTLATGTSGTVTAPAGWAQVAWVGSAWGSASVLYKILTAADLGANINVGVNANYAGQAWQFDVVSVHGAIVGNTAGAGTAAQAFNAGTGGGGFDPTSITMGGTVAAAAIAAAVAACPAANGSIGIDGLPIYTAPAGSPNTVVVSAKLVGQGQAPAFALGFPTNSPSNCAEMVAIPQ